MLVFMKVSKNFIGVVGEGFYFFVLPFNNDANLPKFVKSY
jgi:hypothetical protein